MKQILLFLLLGTATTASAQSLPDSFIVRIAHQLIQRDSLQLQNAILSPQAFSNILAVQWQQPLEMHIVPDTTNARVRKETMKYISRYLLDPTTVKAAGKLRLLNYTYLLKRDPASRLLGFTGTIRLQDDQQIYSFLINEGIWTNKNWHMVNMDTCRVSAIPVAMHDRPYKLSPFGSLDSRIKVESVILEEIIQEEDDMQPPPPPPPLPQKKANKK
ncbi:MAG: hypothetical protein P0Y53_15495 [Candidatus Pseudobacter hemicellulosilyticus]|uniref:Uncharacterized protein n=1 Tax=Candidatus Pseudobacter hemicellulosilyticus TaxID=3121375 RepID=A0AAJ6BF50_9BACT|nr:MAG: hypothetical protein P0Y53_15495 [Pseudobacter sp.]